jgi:hypothetical protein
MKCKKSLLFVELISELLVESGNNFPENSLINGDLFLIASSDPWYGYMLVYIHTLKCPSSASRDKLRKICHKA